MHKKLVIIWLVVVLCYAATNANDTDPIGKETGVAELTKDQFYGLINGKIDSLQVTKVEEHQYSGLKPIPDSNLPPQPPAVNCWKLFNIFMTTYKSTFQVWANQNCRPYIGCWSCPSSGLFILFAVNPTVLCPVIANPTYAAKIAVFEPQLQSQTGRV